MDFEQIPIRFMECHLLSGLSIKAQKINAILCFRISKDKKMKQTIIPKKSIAPHAFNESSRICMLYMPMSSVEFRNHRIILGISQERLAELLGADIASIKNIERQAQNRRCIKTSAPRTRKRIRGRFHFIANASTFRA